MSTGIACVVSSYVFRTTAVPGTRESLSEYGASGRMNEWHRSWILGQESREGKCFVKRSVRRFQGERILLDTGLTSWWKRKPFPREAWQRQKARARQERYLQQYLMLPHQKNLDEEIGVRSRTFQPNWNGLFRVGERDNLWEEQCWEIWVEDHTRKLW